MSSKSDRGIYRANLSVIPDIGSGLDRRLADDWGMEIPEEYRDIWDSASNYVAVVNIPEERYPLRKIVLSVPVIARGRGCRLDFEHARYTLTGESFKHDYNLRGKEKDALLALAESKSAKTQIMEAVGQLQQERKDRLQQDKKEKKTLKPKRFTVFFKLENLLGKPAYGFGGKRGHRIPESRRGYRHNGGTPV